ncbi:MAG: hypothetical protein AAGA30_01825 [Planctomycetota bacterium]
MSKSKSYRLDDQEPVDCCQTDYWGARVNVLEPDLDWTSNFDLQGSVEVEVNDGAMLQQTIDNSNADTYTTIRITLDLVLPGPVYVTKGKTRIIGDGSTTISFPQPNQPVAGFIQIESGEVVVSHLKYSCPVSQEGFAAISVRSSATHVDNVLIEKNEVFGLEAEDGHAILVDGREGNPITNVTIQHNTIRDMVQGTSETISLTGDVRRWLVFDNHIDNVNNIAIDAIGGEGRIECSSDPCDRECDSLQGTGSIDAAREGIIEANIIKNMITTGPAQGAAIYVDGGRDIIIRNNEVYDSDCGIEIGAENCVIAANILVSGNIVESSRFFDLKLGGYAKKGYLDFNSGSDVLCCKTDDVDEGHGYVCNITVGDDNQFRTTSQEWKLNYRIRKSLLMGLGIAEQNANRDPDEEWTGGPDAHSFRTGP